MVLCHNRNNIIFDNGMLSLSRWCMFLKDEFKFMVLKAKASIKPQLENWFCNLNFLICFLGVIL
jgi:hypothetical protein